MEHSSPPGTTTLKPPWLQIARIFWFACVMLAVIAIFASTYVSTQEPLPSCGTGEFTCGPWTMTREDAEIAVSMGLPENLVRILVITSSLIVGVAFVAIGLVIFIKRSDDWIALMLSLMLVLFLVEGIYNLGAFMPVVTVLYLIASIIFILIPFIFPNGIFVPGWTKYAVLIFVIFGAPVSVIPNLNLGIREDLYALWMLLIFGSWFIVGVYSVVYRYRKVSTMVERQQTKWVLAGILGTFIAFIPFIIVSLWFPPAEPSNQRLMFMFFVYLPVYVLSYLLMPTGIAFSILRYRLWDIDLIIRRSLVYLSLSTILLIVFFGVVTLSSSIITQVTGQQSSLSLVLSTLLIAALFNPLRRRIQNGIDRRFYRRKYNAEQVLSNFSLITRSETDINVLISKMTRVIDESVQPESVSVWLRRKD